MYNLYCEKKKLEEKNKREEENKIKIKLAEIHKSKTKNLALKYEDRLRKFIVSIAEENPKLILNDINKKITNSRETFLYENENLILGKKRLTLKYFPPKNEKFDMMKKKFIKNNSFNTSFYNNKYNNFNKTQNISFENNKIKNNSLINFFNMNLKKNNNITIKSKMFHAFYF